MLYDIVYMIWHKIDPELSHESKNTGRKHFHVSLIKTMKAHPILKKTILKFFEIILADPAHFEKLHNFYKNMLEIKIRVLFDLGFVNSVDTLTLLILIVFI